MSTMTCHFSTVLLFPYTADPALLSVAQVFDASLDTKHRNSFHFSGSGSTALGKLSLNDLPFEVSLQSQL